MTRHKFRSDWRNLWGMLKYPISVYKYWFLNNWNYFTKPKLSAKIAEYKQKIKEKL